MKIGILTHQYIDNYGAFLQAYALRKQWQKRSQRIRSKLLIVLM